MRFPWLFVSLLSITAPAMAEKPDASTLVWAEEEVVPITQAMEEGAQLYLHDRAASVATDTVVAERRRFRRIESKLGGWITEELAGERIRVSFLDKPERNAEATRQVLIRVIVDQADKPIGKPQWLAKPEPASAWETAAANALQAAKTADAFEPCVERYNSVVLPRHATGDDAGGLTVWMLPATMVAEEIPFGGAFRFEFDPAGQTLQRSRTFTRTCGPMPHPGANAQALMVSHLLDPIPTALHVWISLQHRLPLFVLTKDGRMWAVEGAQIRLVKNPDEIGDDEKATDDA
jgi:hypothetical protein